MPKFIKNIQITDVDRIIRPGVGHIYKGTMTIGDLAEGLADGNLKYAPKYQRGADIEDEKIDAVLLLDVTDEKLEIDPHRAAQMAAKYLLGLEGDHDGTEEDELEFFNPDVIWNARKSGNDLDYDKTKRRLTVHSTITIPDSAHRHYMSYLLWLWKNDPAEIPDEIELSSDGRAIDALALRKLLQTWDPYDEETSGVFVEIFNVSPAYEGRLFDEYNVEGKRPTQGAAIDMHPGKDAARKFVVTKLMKKCPIFARTEIEIRGSTIGKNSRKITTLATLVSAVRPFQKDLLKLQEDQKKYDDLMDFVCNFYSEWSTHYTEFAPTASGVARQELREQTFAMTNIMFFPMMRLAFELWMKYVKAGIDWKSESEWKDALAKLAGKVKTTNAKGADVTVDVMARDYSDSEGNFVEGNPDWQGKILVQKFDQEGNPTGWSLSSTRQTRDAAYHYLAATAGLRV
jgi:hypothetical protein